MKESPTLLARGFSTSTNLACRGLTEVSVRYSIRIIVANIL